MELAMVAMVSHHRLSMGERRMQIPVQVTFRGMAVSDAAEAQCWDEAARLDKFFDRITSCRVVID